MGGYSSMDAQSVSVLEETQLASKLPSTGTSLHFRLPCFYTQGNAACSVCPSVSSQGLDKVAEVKGPLAFTSIPWRSDSTFVWRGSPSP